MPEWFNGAVLKIVEGFVLRGFKSYSLRQNWGVVKWLRHRSLTPTFRGSNPLTPAKNANNRSVVVKTSRQICMLGQIKPAHSCLIE